MMPISKMATSMMATMPRRRMAVALALAVVIAAPRIARAQEECADAARHPEWIFCHDFEAADAGQFNRYWDDIYGAPDRMFLIDEHVGGVPGGRSLRLQVVNTTDQALASGVTSGPTKFLGRNVDWDTIFYRRYVRFNAEFRQGNFMHLGGLIACHPSIYPWNCLGHAGERPKGNERFTSNLEPWSNYQRLPFPGRWGFYSYYHKMYKDCGLPGPNDCYGDLFTPDTDAFLSRGAWHVIEMAIDAGTPGQADGSQTFWIDGRKIYTAPGIAWRTVPELRVNEVGAALYIHNEPAHTTNILDVDNILLSRRYVGPAACAEGEAITAPCRCGGAADPERYDNVHDSGTCVGGVWSGAGGTATVTAVATSTTPRPTGTSTSTSVATTTAAATATGTARPSVTPTVTVVARVRAYLPWASRIGRSVPSAQYRRALRSALSDGCAAAM